MKVRVIHEFKDKYSDKLHRIDEELDLPVKRINEILKVGGFIEIAEPEQTEQNEQSEQSEGTPPDDQKENQGENQPDGDEQQETAAPTTTGRRKRSK